MEGKIKYICNHYYRDFFRYPNVVGVGNGYKRINNINTNQRSIVVLVSKKCNELHLHPSSRIPKTYMGIKTDVVEVGEIKPFSNRDKIRPMQFGYSISTLSVAEGGTAGCMVKSKFNPSLKFILSCNHILANINTELLGTPIIQPAPEDGGDNNDVVANLYNYVPLRFIGASMTPVNFADVAIAKLNPQNIAIPMISYLGTPKGIVQPYVGQFIVKSGRSTDLTGGDILYVNTTLNVNYGNGRVATFVDQIVSDIESMSGDSGSLVLDENKYAVGIVFGGNETVGFTYINPIEFALELLDVDLVTE